MGRARIAFWPLAVSVAGGCGGAPSGMPASVDDGATTATIAEVTTFERDGLRVLWNGPVERGPVGEEEGFAAGNHDELYALWAAIGMARQSPRVDFSREVVFALAAPGGVCPNELTHVSVDRSGVVRVSGPPWTGSCVDVLTRTAAVVALPRRLLGGSGAKVTVVWSDHRAAFQFGVPSAPAAEALPDASAAMRATALQGEASPESRAMEATLPPRGHMAVTRLVNGAEVWLVHHRDGSVDVLSAAVPTRDANFFLQRVERDDALFVAPAWDRESGRFRGGYDARGHNVHGWAPMQRYDYVRSSGDRVRVLGSSEIAPPSPILPPEAAPILDAPTAAYEHAQRRLFTEFAAIPDGNVELLATDVVWGLSGKPRLCRAPALAVTSETFPGCPDGAPIVAGSVATESSAVLVLEGPVLVRRRGPRLAEVIVTGRPSARVIGSSR
jgi:hypothetical protein